MAKNPKKPANHVIDEKRAKAARKGWTTRRRDEAKHKLVGIRQAKRAVGLPTTSQPVTGKIPKDTVTSLRRKIREERKSAKEALAIERAKAKAEGREEAAAAVEKRLKFLLSFTEQDVYWDKRDGTAAVTASFVRVMVEQDAEMRDELQRAYDRWEAGGYDEELLESMCAEYAEQYELPESHFYTFFTS
jgi:hypothetical protein